MYNLDYIVLDSYYFIYKNCDCVESLMYKYILKNQSCVGLYIIFLRICINILNIQYRVLVFVVESEFN